MPQNGIQQLNQFVQGVIFSPDTLMIFLRFGKIRELPYNEWIYHCSQLLIKQLAPSLAQKKVMLVNGIHSKCSWLLGPTNFQTLLGSELTYFLKTVRVSMPYNLLKIILVTHIVIVQYITLKIYEFCYWQRANLPEGSPL